jgi:hypothetical protein
MSEISRLGKDGGRRTGGWRTLAEMKVGGEEKFNCIARLMNI